ncbi:MAG: glutamate racemase [Patescibacteria group bacterium]|jgi:glutamate racemase
MIGLFDSGIGGLTVVKALLDKAPKADFVYLGDTARTPYGNKTQETVERYAKEDAEYVIKHGAQLVIVACNTASALALPKLQEAFPDIPFIGVVKPATQAAAALGRERVGVIGTKATVNSGIYEKVVHKYESKAKIIQKVCPLFVPLVEEGMLDDQVTKIMVKRYLTPLRQANVGSLILGCTHYPFLKDQIQRFMGKKVVVIDSASTVIQQAMEAYPDLFEPKADPSQIIAFTDTSEASDKLASRWLGRQVKAVKAVLQS